MKTFITIVSALIIFAAANFITYKLTANFYEVRAVEIGYGWYNNILEFQWFPRADVSDKYLQDMNVYEMKKLQEEQATQEKGNTDKKNKEKIEFNEMRL